MSGRALVWEGDWQTLAPTLRRELARGPLNEVLAHRGADLRALAEVSNTELLLARLEAARPYSEERDALLGDLLRLHRRCRDGAVLGALLYALHPGVLRRCRRYLRGPRSAIDGVAEIVHATVVCVEAFDPEQRSCHVQAGLERDASHRLWLACQTSERDRVARAAVAVVAGIVPTAEPFTVLCGRGSEARCAEHLDVPGAEALRERLVARGLLRPRGAELVVRVDVLGQRLREAAGEMGLGEAAAKKALQRARGALRRQGAGLAARVAPEGLPLSSAA